MFDMLGDKLQWLVTAATTAQLSGLQMLASHFPRLTLRWLLRLHL